MHREIRNASDERLDYEFHGDPTDTSFLAIIGHGVTGNKDRPWAVGLGRALEEAGINALRFSFAGNGESEGRFEDCTVTKEVGDLKAVLDAAEDAGYNRICYLGHSMGGAVGVISAAGDERIDLLVSLSGMVYTKRFYETEFGDETPDRGCMWEDESCPLSRTFVEDMIAIDNVLDRTEKIEVPWLVVHGDADDVVPVEEGREIFAAACEPKELAVLPGVDHVYSDGGLAPMIEAVRPWLKAHRG